MLGREADLALVRSPPVNSGLSMLLRLATEAVCIMPPGHPLQALDEIGPADLIGVDLVLLGRQRSLRQQIDQAFRQGRMMPQIKAEVHSVEMACRLAAQGIGVSIVNGLFAALCQDMGIVRRPFRPVIDYCVGMATLAGQPPHPLDVYKRQVWNTSTSSRAASGRPGWRTPKKRASSRWSNPPPSNTGWPEVSAPPIVGTGSRGSYW